MEVIWQRGPSTVNDVVDALPAGQPRAYSTVLTTLRILERKGYLGHRQEGRAYLYHPLVDRHAVREGALKYVMDRFFDNSAELLMLNLFKGEHLTPEDLERLRKLIDDREEEQ
jgi:predicted transcriptional regulator